MKQKSVGKLFFQAFLLLVLLFGLVWVIVIKSGPFAGVESIALLVLLLLSVVGLITYNSYGENMLFLVYSLYLVNILVLGLLNRSFYITLLLVGLVGLVVSMPRRVEEHGEECKPCETSCEPAKMFSPPPQKVMEAKVQPKVTVESKESAVPAKTQFIPGKYVASKRSNVYHEPKCEWAKKVQKDRQLWFAEKKDALNKGYKKHSCVQ